MSHRNHPYPHPHPVTRGERLVGRCAWAMAWVGLVVGQLHALARHNTIDGAKDLQQPLTRLWSDPARAALRPLLDWASADTVYLTYGKIWFPVFLAFTTCAFVAYRRRAPQGFERVAWRTALAGYVVATVALLEYYTMWTHYLADGPATAMFALSLVGMFGSLVGSTLLGIVLLRNGFRPRAGAWLLATAIPLAAGILTITSMGSAALPIMFAFGIIGHRIGSGTRAGAASASTPDEPPRLRADRAGRRTGSPQHVR